MSISRRRAAPDPRHARRLGAATVGTVVAALLVLGLAGCGGGSDASSTKVIRVEMSDYEFTPDVFSVEAGTTVTFQFTNDGQVVHEAFIGTEAEQAAHEQAMVDASAGKTPSTTSAGRMPTTDATDEVAVKAGATGELTHTFAKAGTFILGCHELGHYAKNMKATITVT